MYVTNNKVVLLTVFIIQTCENSAEKEPKWYPELTSSCNEDGLPISLHNNYNCKRIICIGYLQWIYNAIASNGYI